LIDGSQQGEGKFATPKFFASENRKDQANKHHHTTSMFTFESEADSLKKPSGLSRREE
jgi:hypothetical protein